MPTAFWRKCPRGLSESLLQRKSGLSNVIVDSQKENISTFDNIERKIRDFATSRARNWKKRPFWWLHRVYFKAFGLFNKICFAYENKNPSWWVEAWSRQLLRRKRVCLIHYLKEAESCLNITNSPIKSANGRTSAELEEEIEKSLHESVQEVPIVLFNEFTQTEWERTSFLQKDEKSLLFSPGLSINELVKRSPLSRSSTRAVIRRVMEKSGILYLKRSIFLLLSFLKIVLSF